MNLKQNLPVWSTVLYVVVVLASLPMTARGGGAPPLGLDPALATIIAQVGTILLPTLIFLALVREPAQEMLNLRRLDFGSALKSFLVGFVCWPMFTFLSTVALILVGLLQPAASGGPSAPPIQSGSPWLAFLGIVLVAPLFEEMLFRGVLLSTFQQRLGRHAIWLVGILFGFLHPALDQALGAVFIGIVAGWVVYRTRSLWAGVALHAGTNLIAGILMLLLRLAAPAGTEAAAQAGNPEEMVWIGALVWGVIGLLMLVPAFFLLRSLARRHPAPEAPREGLGLRNLWAPAAAVIGVVGFALYDLLQAT